MTEMGLELVGARSDGTERDGMTSPGTVTVIQKCR